MKKFAGERKARFVLDQQMIDRVSSAPAAYGRAAGDANAQCIDVAGTDVFDLGKADAVFVTKRQVSEKIFDRVDAALGEEFGALRADSFEHAHVGLQTFGHIRFISSP